MSAVFRLTNHYHRDSLRLLPKAVDLGSYTEWQLIGFIIYRPLLQIRSFLSGMSLEMWDDAHQSDQPKQTHAAPACTPSKMSESIGMHTGATIDRLLCSGVSNRRHKPE